MPSRSRADNGHGVGIHCDTSHVEFLLQPELHSQHLNIPIMSYTDLKSMLAAIRKYNSLVCQAVRQGKIEDLLKEHGEQMVSRSM